MSICVRRMEHKILARADTVHYWELDRREGEEHSLPLAWIACSQTHMPSFLISDFRFLTRCFPSQSHILTHDSDWCLDSSRLSTDSFVGSSPLLCLLCYFVVPRSCLFTRFFLLSTLFPCVTHAHTYINTLSLRCKQCFAVLVHC